MAHSIAEELTGLYRRKIWFLYEWLMDVTLDLPGLTTGNYVDLVDSKIQYAITNGIEVMKGHRIRNNLPGTDGASPAGWFYR
ncbi:hypothetical protein [Arcticibacter sp.]|uniref:hypothetical protein n=1 Tax=Arcticibacter sp. TaxID=1872630 RepID=UPI00388DCFAB